MRLKNDILKAAKVKGIDPYTEPFKPSDLGLIVSDYGSFSDHCSKEETVSGKWADDVILTVAERNVGGKLLRYLLIK